VILCTLVHLTKRCYLPWFGLLWSVVRFLTSAWGPGDSSLGDAKQKVVHYRPNKDFNTPGTTPSNLQPKYGWSVPTQTWYLK